ncbi:MAG: DUF4149 domain-containing protein [Acidobacteriaceae bacterium]
MLTFLRTLMLLALILWLGGILFFSAVEAPAIFRSLGSPDTIHLAGDIISRSLTSLHYIGLTCGVIFILCGIAARAEVHKLIVTGESVTLRAARGGSLSIPLVLLMMLLTGLSQFWIAPRLRQIHNTNPNLEQLTHEEGPRAEFDRLHAQSTYLEGAVLLLGLGVVVLTARRLA